MKLRTCALVLLGMAGTISLLANSVSATGAGLSVTGSLSPDPATVGQPVQLSGSAKNITTHTILYGTVGWKVTDPNGAVVTSGSQFFVIFPGQTLSASASYTPTVKGTYTGTVTARDQLGSLTLTASATAN